MNEEWIFENDHVDFNDDDFGYEILAQALDSLGVDWTYYRDNGYQGYCSVVSHDYKVLKPQLAFEIPASQTMKNGETTIKFGVYAGIYDAIKQTLLSIRDQLKNESIQLMTLAVNGDEMLFVLGDPTK